MAPANRVKVLVAGVLALAVMAFVVTSALVARGHEGDDRDADGLPRPAGGSGHVPRMALAGCDVTPGRPPAIAIELPANRLDLGSHRQGQTVEREVTVRNPGSGVCIEDVRTGCGCVKAEWVGDKHVPAGAAGVVRVSVDTTNREGVQEKPVTLYTNVPGRSSVEFLVHVEVRLGLMVVPLSGAGPATFLQFGTRPPGRPSTVTVRLKSPKGEPPWELLGVEAGEAGKTTPVTVRLTKVEPTDPAFDAWDLAFTHPGRVELGTESERLRVRTTHKERPALEFDAMLTVVTKVYAAPSRASFGFVRPKDPPPMKTVYLVPGEPGATFTVTGATVEGDGFVADPPRRTKEGWAVDVRYDGRSRGPGKVTATLVVAVDDPELPTVKVPLEGQLLGS